jgi:outer membrane PBP1 activator LpoA protein
MRKAMTWTAGPKWLLALAAVLLFAGCATVRVSSTAGKPAEASDNAAIQTAGALARNDAALSGQAKVDNARQIDRLLSGLDDATLARETAMLAADDPLYNFAGRALLRRGLPLPRPFERSARWNFDAGQRPPADRDGYRPPTRLAVLLPLSGNMATAAAPVRDGLLAGYYGERRQRPDIQFYDTTGTPGGAVAAYAKAAAEGNDFVVGPLGRDEVSALFNQGNLSVPMLALNRGNVAPPAGNASFSLAPEDEAISAAEYLIANHARRVLVLNSSDATMRRAADAFRERLGERGGVVTETLTVGESAEGFTPALQAAASRQGGIDAIFLAVKGSQARVLAPQLVTAGLAVKPRVATSQLISGTGKPEQDRVLDGIIFPSDAWSARGTPGLPSASMTEQTLPTARGPAARLFAFGFDAWLITAYLERLATSAEGDVKGATGDLRIDGFGNIIRAPAWSTFSGGLVVPLARGGG